MSFTTRTSISPERRAAVASRDGWVCRLCGVPVPRVSRAWAGNNTHPLSPSVDHVLPVSRGGGNAMHNLQLTHLLCNVRRGNRLRWVPDAAHKLRMWALLEANDEPLGLRLKSPDDV